MSKQNSKTDKEKGEWDDIFANPQPTSADKAPIPQPATDGFPDGGEDLTSRVPGQFDDVTKED